MTIAAHIAKRHERTEQDIACNRLNPRDAFSAAHADRLALLALLYSTPDKSNAEALAETG